MDSLETSSFYTINCNWTDTCRCWLSGNWKSYGNEWRFKYITKLAGLFCMNMLHAVQTRVIKFQLLSYIWLTLLKTIDLSMLFLQYLAMIVVLVLRFLLKNFVIYYLIIASICLVANFVFYKQSRNHGKFCEWKVDNFIK